MGWVVGFVRRRGWGQLWGFLFQWNGMCRSVIERDVEVLTFGLVCKSNCKCIKRYRPI